MGGDAAEHHILARVDGGRVHATAVTIVPGLTPRMVWAVLTEPEGADIFRVESRQQLANDGAGRWRETVVFLAAVRVLFWKAWAKTRVEQAVDASDPARVTVEFRLLRSGLMSALEGSWELRQLGGGGAPPATRVEYRFAMWPKGVPPALRFMPGLLDAVTGAVSREAAQLLDKIQYVAAKVRPGVGVAQAVREAAGEVSRSGGTFKLLQQALLRQQSVQCHALADDGYADGEQEEEELEQEQAAAGKQTSDVGAAAAAAAAEPAAAGGAAAAAAASEAGSDASVYHSGASSPPSSGADSDDAGGSEGDVPGPADQARRGRVDAAVIVEAPAPACGAGGAAAAGKPAAPARPLAPAARGAA
ncbi:hypothetical protein HT031_005656 [Scenedesmus sp. PABB004]|nr:hypothetical protein HT031_005656 [Scenedesmus sp. PABB004]